MSGLPRFELVPIERLRVHEEVDGREVRRLVEKLRRSRSVREPLLVADGSFVILNGHHRFAALREIGARRAPAWIVDYDDPAIELGRWTPGPPIPKSEVISRGEEGRPFPPKTTKHTVRLELVARPTPLARLGIAPPRTGRPATTA
ncbi:MAG TPA: ParB N-terminal domain-containing protein [Thermoplasmata archaeon]